MTRREQCQQKYYYTDNENLRRSDPVMGAWSDNQACLYSYDVAILPMLTDEGMLSTDKPSPLTRDEVADVLKHIARHPEYRKQTVICHDENFVPVTLCDGKVWLSGKPS